MIKEYRRLRSIHEDELVFNQISEMAVTVQETNRIRILLVRQSDEPERIRMDIEVILPEKMWGLDANLSSNEMTTLNQPELRLTLEETILLFQYLLNLQTIGFNLDLFSDEGVWVASYYFDKEPSKTLFTQCKPPKLKAN
ncbi:MAG: hypothetical protein ACFFBR_03810 [Promethearchaeota archaeon]